MRIRRLRRFIALTLAVLLALLPVAPALAAPSGGSVVSGSAIITQAGGITKIVQATGQVIINWQNFGIGVGEVVNFIQPSSLAVALNRVTGVNPSVILGSLNANGRIFLINPNGILFGKGSQVNVGGLTATTLCESNSCFLAGKTNLAQVKGKPLASVINQGCIKVADGGYAVLVAPLVDNEGVIVANLGQVVLGGTTHFSVAGCSCGLINYVVDSSSSHGNVTITPQGLSNILSTLVNSKLVNGSVVNQCGQVVLMGAEGTVLNAGTIAADG
ncbi:MAG: two-partner secretion domain-containing protein, partial [Candidatus Xenobia bacterium]